MLVLDRALQIQTRFIWPGGSRAQLLASSSSGICRQPLPGLPALFPVLQEELDLQTPL